MKVLIHDRHIQPSLPVGWGWRWVEQGADGAGSWGLGLPHPRVFNSLLPSIGLLPAGTKRGQRWSLGVEASLPGGDPWNWEFEQLSHPNLGGQDPPELSLLQLVRACDLSVHLAQLPGKGGS